MAGVAGAGEDVLARIDSGDGGVYHLQHHNPLGTALLLQAALRRLERYPARFGGVSVTFLCDAIRQRLQALEADEGAQRGTLRSDGIRSPNEYAVCSVKPC